MKMRPNLLFLFSDQHAFNVAGCYGNAIADTPNLDRLAASGVTFDAAYCPSPVCVPSRMSMLTARHPSAQDCWTNDDILGSGRATWLHALGAADYRPVLIGRLHAMGPDQLHGYAERKVGDHSPNWGGVPRHDLGVLNETNDPHRTSVIRSGPGQSAYELKDRDVTQAAVDYFDRLGEERRAGGSAEPFAVTVGFMLPHAPYVASRVDFERFAGRVPPPRHGPPAVGNEHPWLNWWRQNRGIEHVEAADAQRARAAYYGLTYRLDAMIGEVLAALERNGLADNTLVVYASDHGDQLGERGLWWKHTFYEESARVPMIMSWPGVLPAGERRPQVVNLVDLAATMLEALGAPQLPNAQGRSFLGVAKDAAAPWVDETVSEYCTDTVPIWTGGMAVRQRMLRQGRWKLIYYDGYPPQLFDLTADPDEQTDLAADAAHAPVRDRLLARLLADWRPEEIERRMNARRQEKDLIGAWARNTNPANTYVWPTRPDQNCLED
jgi:choline-sulfatase